MLCSARNSPSSPRATITASPASSARQKKSPGSRAWAPTPANSQLARQIGVELAGVDLGVQREGARQRVTRAVLGERRRQRAHERASWAETTWASTSR